MTTWKLPGYVPRYHLWVFEVDFEPERYRDILQRMLRSPECDVRPIDKRHWGMELETLRALFNAGMRDEWEMQQFTAPELKELFRPIWRFAIDARLITQFAVANGEPIGFVIGAVDLVPYSAPFRDE